MHADELGKWQRTTLLTLFTGYAGYYLCRSNLAIATPLIEDAFSDQGISHDDMGLVASVGVALYALGKIVNGILSDSLGGRTLFLFGMAASVGCTVLFGLSSALWAFVVLWGVNRFFQSMGWVSLVNVASRWFPVHRHATVMGLLSMSFLLGDALVRFFLGAVVWIGERNGESPLGILAHWRSTFFVAALALTAILCVALRLLKASPSDVGLEEPHANPVNVFGSAGHAAARTPLRELLRPLLSSRLFWLICGMNFGLTLVRETFNFWTPTFLKEAAGFETGQAGVTSLLFPLTGGVAAYLAGVMSDRFGGRHGRIVVPAMILLIAALGGLAWLDASRSGPLTILLICSVSFCLIAPYSYLSGVMALELGGKRGSSTAAGLIDSAGYFGAILSGWAVGAVAEKYGWSTAFAALAVLCALTMVFALAYWYEHETTLNRHEAAAPSVAESPVPELETPVADVNYTP